MIGVDVDRAEGTPDGAVAPFQPPLDPSALIGRRWELGLACAALSTPGAAALLTVTGAPGVGKTRLAVAAAWQVRTSFADGIRFLDLAETQPSERLLALVARALGARPGADDRATLARLAIRLRGRQILLLLDSLERRLTEAPALSGLLQVAPGLRVLVTSREPLGLSAERRLRLRPLALPVGPDLAAIVASPAVRLLVRRAHLDDPTFALTRENAAAVAAICARTDGLPLALEAAAERIKAFRPAALLASLVRASSLLRRRDAPARHRTVEDLVEWSWPTIAPAEGALLERLSVFAGSFTLDAAKAVAGDRSPGGGEPDQTLGQLIDLVDKSLLESESAPTGEARFRLLAPIRAHLRDRLEVAGEDAAAAERRRDYFLELGEARLRQGELTALEPDLANLQSALDCAAEQGDHAVAVRLSAVLAAYWRQRGPWDVDLPWRPPSIVSDDPTAAGGPDRVALQTLLAYEAWLRGEWDLAERLLVRCLADARQIGDRFGMADAELGLARLSGRTGDPTWSRRLLGAAGMHYRSVGDRCGEGLVLAELAGQALEHGDPAASGLYAEALALVDGSGPRTHILEGAAAAAVAAGSHLAAARLLGAAAPRGRRPLDRPSDRSERVDALANRIRSKIGDQAYSAAVDSGRRTSGDALIDLVRALGRAAPAAEIEASPQPNGATGLVAREQAVLSMAASGLATKQIARRLGLGERTVKGAVAQAREKLGARNRAHAIARATELGLLALPPAN